MIDSQFIGYESYEDYEKEKPEIPEDSVVLIAEENKGKIIMKGQEYNLVPSGGKKGQMLISDEKGNPEWGTGSDSQAVIESVSGETLTALVNRYYRFDSPINTLAVTLPAIPTEENPRIKSIVLSFTTGDSPQVTISADADIEYFSGYSIEADTTYELNLLFNGSKWIVAYGVVE